MAKSSATRELILKAVRGNLLFHNLDDAQREQIVNEMHRETVRKGDLMIKQGKKLCVF